MSQNFNDGKGSFGFSESYIPSKDDQACDTLDAAAKRLRGAPTPRPVTIRNLVEETSFSRSYIQDLLKRLPLRRRNLHLEDVKRSKKGGRRKKEEV
jgi:hypothetical protein